MDVVERKEQTEPVVFPEHIPLGVRYLFGCDHSQKEKEAVQVGSPFLRFINLFFFFFFF